MKNDRTAKGVMDASSVRSSRHNSIQTHSLTSFPNLSTDALSQDVEFVNEPLNGLLDRDGPSMFDESNALDSSDPQALSAAPANVLQNVIDHNGAAELVRRLSTMLAERDAHITALTRLAEEYKVPRSRIAETSSRVKQAERRRLSLAAASEKTDGLMMGMLLRHGPRLS